MVRLPRILKQLKAKFSSRPAPKVGNWEVAGLRATFKGKRLTTTPIAADSFFREHKRVIIPTYRLIRENFWALVGGEVREDTKRGIKIQKAATGSYKGKRHALALNVKVHGKEFFVKVFSKGAGWKILKGIDLVDKFLSKQDYKVGEFNVEVIKPRLVYEGPEHENGFLVTDFYSEGQVTQVADLKGALGKRASKTLDWLSTAVGSATFGVTGIHPNNSFYDHKSKTILLYDLEFLPGLTDWGSKKKS
ncbi:MAG: hypothetical protein QGI60_06055 [archaeon]|jgi:ribosomal protein S13|nr:hypothetical protein [archaeon]